MVEGRVGYLVASPNSCLVSHARAAVGTAVRTQSDTKVWDPVRCFALSLRFVSEYGWASSSMLRMEFTLNAPTHECSLYGPSFRRYKTAEIPPSRMDQKKGGNIFCLPSRCLPSRGVFLSPLDFDQNFVTIEPVAQVPLQGERCQGS